MEIVYVMMVGTIKKTSINMGMSMMIHAYHVKEVAKHVMIKKLALNALTGIKP